MRNLLILLTLFEVLFNLQETTAIPTALNKPVTAEALGMQWSYASPIPGKHCVQWVEPWDLNTWNDNYLCFNADYGVRWHHVGAITGMDCSQVLEQKDPDYWGDNFVCVPKGNPWRFQFNSSGPIPGRSCVQTLEPSDPYSWDNNYICVKGQMSAPMNGPVATKETLGMKWSYKGPIAGLHCIQWEEPVDPDFGTGNYLCFNKDYGVRWSHVGQIKDMDCTEVVEPSDPHTWKDNFLCVPAGTPWHLQWNYCGPVPGLTCVQTYVPRDPDTWADNYICVIGHMEGSLV